MNLQKVRWPVVVATMAFTLAALFGAGFVLKSRTVDEPLKMLYGGSQAVESHRIERHEDGYEIKVMLKDTPDLAAAYRTLDEETKKILKGQSYALKVEDRRSPQLEQTMRRANLFVQEALATGQFATMADRIEEEAAKAGATARLAVDNDRVYVQLHQNDAYLYSVVDRAEASPKVLRVEGGFGL